MESKLCPPLNTLSLMSLNACITISSPEAALMELTLLVKRQGHAETSDNVRTALDTIGENAGHIHQGLARLKAQGPD
jgi:hypothetical protein